MSTAAHRTGFGSATLDIERIQRDFPILAERIHGKRLVYLDNAATSQKPRAVIDAIVHYYEHLNANIHRGVHTLSVNATEAHDEARETVRRFIQAADANEIIFVRGATEAINLVAGRMAAPTWAKATKCSSPPWSTTPTLCRGKCCARKRARISALRP